MMNAARSVNDSIKVVDALNETFDKPEQYPEFSILEHGSADDENAGAGTDIPTSYSTRFLQILAELKIKCAKKMLADPATELGKV